tara:strand:- start:1348 stop:1800 length:453 start_codon:yes stop_codon:yes gene_type:complete
MKRIILLFSLVISSITFGQENFKQKKLHHKKAELQMMKDLSAEQIATLKTKKMTLALDLTKVQQNKIQALNIENANIRKEEIKNREQLKGTKKTKLTSIQKYEKMNATLDKKIEIKSKVKAILNEEQFKKWEGSQKQMMHQNKRHTLKKK